jgi:hypothetical protein
MKSIDRQRAGAKTGKRRSAALVTEAGSLYTLGFVLGRRHLPVLKSIIKGPGR